MRTQPYLDAFIKECTAAKPADSAEKFMGWDDVVCVLAGATLRTFLPELKEWFKLGALVITTKRMELRKKLENYAMEKELDFSSAQKAAEVIAGRINEKNIQKIIEALESSDSK